MQVSPPVMGNKDHCVMNELDVRFAAETVTSNIPSTCNFEMSAMAIQGEPKPNKPTSQRCGLFKSLGDTLKQHLSESKPYQKLLYLQNSIGVACFHDNRQDKSGYRSRGDRNCI